MKNILTKILVFCLILMAVNSEVNAQESNTLQFMKGMSQSNLQNPALHNDSSTVVIGFPGLSGLYFDFNSGFAANDLIHKGTGSLADSLVLDIDGFHNSLKTTNTIEQNFSLPLFYLGIRGKKSFFSLGITEKEQTQFAFDKNLVTFLKDGNAPYMGQNFDLGDISMNSYQYMEVALGYSNELINNKLTIGLRAKALFGRFAMQTERMRLKVETAADGSYLNLSSDMKINLSAPVTPEYDDEGYFSGMNTDGLDDPMNFIFVQGNMGMAFDLGAVYKLTPKITLSGSIVDLGKISFKEDVISLNHVSNYKWEGIDFSKSIDESQEDYVDPSDLVDDEMEKIEDSFRPKKSEIGSDPFDMSIPTKIYLGGTYSVNDKFNVGLLDRIYKNGDFSQNTLTLSANTLIGNFLSLTGSYSMIGNSNNNLGLGMAIRLGFMQIYVVGDNVLAAGDPSKATFVNARFGMNFLFGRSQKVKIAEPSEIQ
jgi:hypothetical protein